jgi:hypothetical protein
MTANDMPGRLDALKSVPMFAELDDRALQVLASESQWKRVAGGEELFHQGGAGDSVSIVIAGRLRAELHVDRALAVAPNGPMPLWRSLRRKGSPVPTIAAIMARTAILGGVHAREEVRRRADLYLQAPVEDYGVFDWRSMERLVEVGYEHARGEIASWREG